MNAKPDDPFEHMLPNVYEGIRKIQLLISLHEKLRNVPPGEFAIAAEFEKLCQVVTSQIGETRVLFPEFTPHDERLHVSKLFYLADMFLGRSVYKLLSSSELFLLACALYAHDWGMATGNDEQDYLRHGADPALRHETFTPLSDEGQRLFAFADAEGLVDPISRTFPRLTDDQLRIYVRNTHARRSAARVRAHFASNRGIGEALGHICEGHWHDFGTLDDPDRFPHEYTLGRETVHLLALTLYVRLIDLFHLTDDRTPYALWRFVSPRDRRSAEAWAKHQALHGVSVVEFKPGRAIRVQGSTEDEEVWAGLQDLRHFCEEQVRRTLDLSARHVPQRYSLDFIRLEWAVTTGSLKPVDLRFEFDRTAMFRILSEDIYEGDPYVFVRELLQNAIDATRTRIARGKRRSLSSAPRKAAGPAFDTTIYFDAAHRDNGDVVLSCRDNGIGMDEHVIRNYFSVAGISYYRSSEFERQHLDFEPISRFGVGILSTFMVADRLEVQTYRDPECSPPMADADVDLPGSEQHRARRLNLSIPGVDRQFIVRDGRPGLAIGTEVTVSVSAKKVVQLQKLRPIVPQPDVSAVAGGSGFSRVLNITEYLQDIAGFVEFPIYVKESWPGLAIPLTTLILHPDRDARTEAEQYEGSVEVIQLSAEYPWEKVTDPDSRSSASAHMNERIFDLKHIMPSGGFEGWITFPKPKEEGWDFADNDRNPLMLQQGPKVHWYDRETYNPVGTPIVWNCPPQYSDIREFPMRLLLGVYRDGIRLPGITKVAWGRLDQIFPPAKLCVNLPSGSTPRTNLARTSLTAQVGTWDTALLSALHSALGHEEIEQALTLQPDERLFRLGWLAQVYRLSDQELAKQVPEAKLPIPWIDSGEKFEVTEGAPRALSGVLVAPEELVYVTQVQAVRQFSARQVPMKPHHWIGLRTMAYQTEDSRSRPTLLGMQLVAHWAAKHLAPDYMHFLQPPVGVAELLRQYKSTRISGRLDDEIAELSSNGVHARRAMLDHPTVIRALEIAQQNPEAISAEERDALHRVFAFIPRSPAVLPINFAPPFEKFAATHRGD